MRILLGIPTAGAPAQPFLESLHALEIPKEADAFGHFTVSGNFVPAQRELIVARALAVGADYLAMADDDMVLPSDSLVRLCAVMQERPRCALAGALYYSRDGFRPMAVDDWNPLDTTTAYIPAFTDEPVSVAGVGFGFVVMRMDALRELEPLYFSSHVYIEPDRARVRVCDEDYLFCTRLRDRRWDVVLHAGVRAGHYDRATGSVVPERWETAEETAARRMAVVEEGRPKLVAPADVASPGEFHQYADVVYISPKR